MGLFKGKRRATFTVKKHYRSNYKLGTKAQRRTSKPLTSTPVTTRKRTIHCRKLTPFRSPFAKRPKMSPFNRAYKINSPSKIPAKLHLDFSTDKDESTILYSEENDSQSENAIQSENEIAFDEMFPLPEEEHDENYATFIDALKVFKKHNVDRDIQTFLKLVSEEKFPLDNVSFQLFLDVVSWYNASDTRQARYNETTMKFFWVGKRLFGGRFLRFMGGPKNESQLLLGNTIQCIGCT